MKTFYFFVFVWLESSMSVPNKYIDPRQEEDVIVFSHVDSQNRWIYRKAKLSSGYFFPIDQNKHFKLSDVFTTSEPPTNSIPINTKVVTFPSSGSIGLSDGTVCTDCWMRGVIARVREKGFYDVNTYSCSFSRETQVVQYKSTTINSHISRIKMISDDSENLWKDKICKKSGPLRAKVAFKVSSKCNYYKIPRTQGWLYYVPKVKLTYTEGQPDYFMRISNTANYEVTENKIPALKDIVNNQMVIAKVQNEWVAGYYQRQTPEGRHIVNINNNRNEATEVIINDFWDLRILNYQIRPFCSDSATIPTTESFITTTTLSTTTLLQNITKLCDEVR
jgi:hypothetical protein